MRPLPTIRFNQALETRLLLVRTARRLFGTKGYHSTGTHEIVNEAGVTRGALYHYFPKKEDLFLAVFEEVQADTLVDDEASDTWPGFLEAVDNFLSEEQSSEMQKILLLDGPVVLGWQQWRQHQVGYGLAPIIRAVKAGIASGLIRDQKVEPLAFLILSLINDMIHMIANSDLPDRTAENLKFAFQTLVSKLD